VALDFQQVREQVKQLGEDAPQRQQELAQKRDQALSLLESCAGDIERLRSKVQEVRERDPSLRCALPAILPDGAAQPLNARYPLPPALSVATILAADGSQINLDRHAEVEYSLVNVGAIQMQRGSGQPPHTTVHSRLYYAEQQLNLTEARLALIRDLEERSLLAELATAAPLPLVTFTDGPIELWGAKDASAEDASLYQENLSKYREALTRLHQMGAVTAGYVDKPAANLVVRLLEIVQARPGDLEDIRGFHPLSGVSDRFLYLNLLAPGERSAVFALQSQSAKHYPGALAVHFFYLNVGSAQQSWLARVEVPAWVAHDAVQMDLLHAVLVEQCHILGRRSYPYLLHRAHETAVVTLAERDQVTQMILLELRRRGVALDGASQKQGMKDLPGRKRR
jgi:hypothetical protein